MGSLDNRLEPKAGHVGEMQHLKIALLRFLPPPIPTVGIAKRMVDAGTKGDTLFPQVPERLVSILLCPSLVVLDARHKAPNSLHECQLPARLFALRGRQALFSFINNAAQTGIKCA